MLPGGNTSTALISEGFGKISDDLTCDGVSESLIKLPTLFIGLTDRLETVSPTAYTARDANGSCCRDGGRV